MKFKKVIAAGLAFALAASCASVLCACAGGVQAGAKRTVTDAQGTSYEVPENVEKVAPTIGALTQLTVMLSDGHSKVAATMTNSVSDKFKEIIKSYNESNPQGLDSSDVEALIEAGVQVAYGPSGLYSDEQKQQLADAGISFIPMDGLANVEQICDTCELIGQVLGDEEYARAQEFTAFWKGNIKDAEKRTAKLADADKPKVLNMAFSNGAWTCESGDTLIGSYIEAAGGTNVAKDYSIKSTGGQQGGATLDEEQIVAWDPDYIITYSAEAREQVLSSKALSSVAAVKNGHVFTSPQGLYLWAVRSGEGALMAPWIGTKINEELFDDVDMVKMTQNFFKTYYAYDLSEQDAEKVLEGTF